jgi:CheY-like chemotaxis protein
MTPTKKKILIVDDDVSLSLSLRTALERAGPYEVRTVNDPRKAVHAVRDFEPDLILMDVIMPFQDGGAVAAEIRADPAMSGIPVVFLTSILDKDEAAMKGGRIGPDPVLAKPVTLAELLPVVEKHLKP